jgi:chromosome segregation ATPase
MNQKSEHDRLFDEICNKLKELGPNSECNDHLEDVEIIVENSDSYPQNQKLERIQSQIRRFQSDLETVQGNLLEKMRSMESLQHHQTDLAQQMKVLTDQLQAERQMTVRLNTDLSKSLEINLQLQLELQNARARFQQYQIEEKKYINSLLEKNQSIQKEIELMTAMKDETHLELNKAKAQFEMDLQRLETEIDEKNESIKNLTAKYQDSQAQILDLNSEIEKMGESFSNFEDYRRKQNDALKNLMEAAEKKIVDYKLALDKKTLEAQDYYSHLQQAMTQLALLRNENLQLRDYAQRINAAQNINSVTAGAALQAQLTNTQIHFQTPSSTIQRTLPAQNP